MIVRDSVAVSLFAVVGNGRSTAMNKSHRDRSETIRKDCTINGSYIYTVGPLSPDQDICIAGDGTVHCHSRP